MRIVGIEMMLGEEREVWMREVLETRDSAKEVHHMMPTSILRYGVHSGDESGR